MKKITLKNATEEQIAKNIEMFPEMWGITFPAYEKECTVEKDGDDLKVEIEGAMLLSRNTYVNDDPDATLTLRFGNINWDEEIEIPED